MGSDPVCFGNRVRPKRDLVVPIAVAMSFFECDKVTRTAPLNSWVNDSETRRLAYAPERAVKKSKHQPVPDLFEMDMAQRNRSDESTS